MKWSHKQLLANRVKPEWENFHKSVIRGNIEKAKESSEKIKELMDKFIESTVYHQD